MTYNQANSAMNLNTGKTQLADEVLKDHAEFSRDPAKVSKDHAKVSKDHNTMKLER